MICDTEAFQNGVCSNKAIYVGFGFALFFGLSYLEIVDFFFKNFLNEQSSEDVYFLFIAPFSYFEIDRSRRIE